MSRILRLATLAVLLASAVTIVRAGEGQVDWDTGEIYRLREYYAPRSVPGGKAIVRVQVNERLMGTSTLLTDDQRKELLVRTYRALAFYELFPGSPLDFEIAPGYVRLGSVQSNDLAHTISVRSVKAGCESGASCSPRPDVWNGIRAIGEFDVSIDSPLLFQALLDGAAGWKLDFVLVHELGHGIGLNHNWLNADAMDAYAPVPADSSVMSYPDDVLAAGADLFGGANLSQLRFTADDLATVRRIYAGTADAIPPGAGAIRGVVRHPLAGAAQVLGAAAVLVDAAGKPVQLRVNGYDTTIPARVFSCETVTGPDGKPRLVYHRSDLRDSGWRGAFHFTDVPPGEYAVFVTAPRSDFRFHTIGPDWFRRFVEGNPARPVDCPSPPHPELAATPWLLPDVDWKGVVKLDEIAAQLAGMTWAPLGDRSLSENLEPGFEPAWVFRVQVVAGATVELGKVNSGERRNLPGTTSLGPGGWETPEVSLTTEQPAVLLRWSGLASLSGTLQLVRPEEVFYEVVLERRDPSTGAWSSVRTIRVFDHDVAGGFDVETIDYPLAIPEGGRYRWRVRLGTGSEFGAWTEDRYFDRLAPPPAPVALRPGTSLDAVPGEADRVAGNQDVHLEWVALPDDLRIGAWPIQAERLDPSTGSWTRLAFPELAVVGLGPGDDPGTMRATVRLSTRGTHRWRVAAKNDAGTGAWSEDRKFVVVQPPPTPILVGPGRVAPTYSLVQGSRPTLSWAPAPGEEGDDARIEITLLGALDSYNQGTYTGRWAPIPVPSTPFADLGVSVELEQGRLYRWQARSTNLAGESAVAGPLDFVVDLPAPRLVSPGSAAAPIPRTSGSATRFTWDPYVTNTAISKVEIYVYQYAGTDPIDLSVAPSSVTGPVKYTVPSVGSNSHVVSLPSAGTIHRWTVLYTNHLGWKRMASLRWVHVDLPAPTLLGPASGSFVDSDRALFQWSAIPSTWRARSLRLDLSRRDPSGAWQSVPVPVQPAITDTSILVTVPVRGAEYSWSLSVANEVQATTSPTRTFRVRPPAPTPPFLLGPGEASNYPPNVSNPVTFRWLPHSGEYQIQQYLFFLETYTASNALVPADPNEPFTVVNAWVPGVPIEITRSLAPGVRHRWHVVAVNETANVSSLVGLDFYPVERPRGPIILPPENAITDSTGQDWYPNPDVPSVVFRWVPITESRYRVDGYRVEVWRESAPGGPLDVLEGAWTVTGRDASSLLLPAKLSVPGARYKWIVLATNGTGVDGSSSAYYFRALPTPSSPPLWTGAADASFPTPVYGPCGRLEWGEPVATESVDGWRLEIDDLTTGTTSRISLASSDRSYRPAFPESRRHAWRLQAWNESGSGAWSTRRHIDYRVAPAPATGGDGSTTATFPVRTESSATISWGLLPAAHGATGWQVELAWADTSDRSAAGASAAFFVEGTPIIDDPYLTYHTFALTRSLVLYRMRVRARFPCGAASAWSTPRYFYRLVVAPSPAPISPGASSESSAPSIGGTSAPAPTFEWSVSSKYLVEGVRLEIEYRPRGSSDPWSREWTITRSATNRYAFNRSAGEVLAHPWHVYRWRAAVTNAAGTSPVGAWSYFVLDPPWTARNLSPGSLDASSAPEQPDSVLFTWIQQDCGYTIDAWRIRIFRAPRSSPPGTPLQEWLLTGALQAGAAQYTRSLEPGYVYAWSLEARKNGSHWFAQHPYRYFYTRYPLPPSVDIFSPTSGVTTLFSGESVEITWAPITGKGVQRYAVVINTMEWNSSTGRYEYKWQGEMYATGETASRMTLHSTHFPYLPQSGHRLFFVWVQAQNDRGWGPAQEMRTIDVWYRYR